MRQWLAATAVAGLVAAPLHAFGAIDGRVGPLAEVEAAIVKAVHSRMGSGVTVEVSDLRVRGDLSEAVAILALPDPGTRTGVRTRVALKGLRARGKGARIGDAECVIRVRASHRVAVGPIARGDVIAAALVERAEGWLDGVFLKPLPLDLEMARAIRDLAPGDVVRSQDVALPPPVRNGQQVRVQVRLGRVRVSAEGVAVQDGSLGEEIRIMNPSSGKVLRGRVVGPREVEVTHGT